MYVAACRFMARYGLSAIGIPYQLGLVRCVPASDLVEGMLNNEDRPPVRDPETKQVVFAGRERFRTSTRATSARACRSC